MYSRKFQRISVLLETSEKFFVSLTFTATLNKKKNKKLWKFSEWKTRRFSIKTRMTTELF